MSTTDDNLPPISTVHWGAEGIGKRINRPERAAFHLLEKGRVTGAKRLGNRWYLTEVAARRLLGDEVAE